MRDGTGRGLVLGPVVRPHDEVEAAFQPERRQPLHGRLVSLRRDHAKRHARPPKPLEHGLRAGKQPDQIVVHHGVALAVHAAQLLVSLLAVCEVPHLDGKRLPHLRHEQLVGHGAAQHGAHRVAKRLQDEVVRVEQRPIEVEQDGLDRASSHRSFTDPSINDRFMRRESNRAGRRNASARNVPTPEIARTAGHRALRRGASSPASFLPRTARPSGRAPIGEAEAGQGGGADLAARLGVRAHRSIGLFRRLASRRKATRRAPRTGSPRSPTPSRCAARTRAHR